MSPRTPGPSSVRKDAAQASGAIVSSPKSQLPVYAPAMADPNHLVPAYSSIIVRGYALGQQCLGGSCPSCLILPRSSTTNVPSSKCEWLYLRVFQASTVPSHLRPRDTQPLPQILPILTSSTRFLWKFHSCYCFSANTSPTLPQSTRSFGH